MEGCCYGIKCGKWVFIVTINKVFLRCVSGCILLLYSKVKLYMQRLYIHCRGQAEFIVRDTGKVGL